MSKPYRYAPPPKRGYYMPVYCRAILETLLGLAKYHKKTYCWPSQKRLIALVEKYQGIRMARSTLNRALRWLEDNQYVPRTRRHRRVNGHTGLGKDGHLKPCSTMYSFGHRTFAYLRQMGKAMLDHFSHFKVPNWDREKVRLGTSTLYRSFKKFLEAQTVSRAMAASALGLRV